MARAARAWAELGRAAAEYQAIVADGWANAWAEFLAVLPSRPPSTVRQMLRLWGTTADNVLTELFATETYSRAQGRLVNAAIAYRLAEGEVADLFLEAAHMPTRRQLEDANRAIHDLRREVRSLRREVRG
jgi:class III poly(R)-hydroxyalkanoic acid synthase PhaE subunit